MECEVRFKDKVLGPTKKDFPIPEKKVENDDIIRILLFNKANKEFKKTYTGIINSRKQKNISKLSNQSDN
jgi:hypothetical protein